LIARGRDATDVAISNTFGPNTLLSFKVWTDEVQHGVAMSGGDLAAAPGDGAASATYSTEPEVPAVLGAVRSASTGQAL
jgi:hypothetical protein